MFTVHDGEPFDGGNGTRPMNGPASTPAALAAGLVNVSRSGGSKLVRATYRDSADTLARTSACARAIRVRCCVPLKRTTAIAASVPITAITISNSMSVKPFGFGFIADDMSSVKGKTDRNSQWWLPGKALIKLEPGAGVEPATY